jgi:hypothetical protein
MGNHEYRILHGPPDGIALFPWASQALKDAIGRGSFEKKLNKLAEEGWEVVSCSTATEGIFLWMRVTATVLLRSAKPSESGSGAV